jgi:photosystem II stability/assembly factor-like uncharacterized protein
LNKIDIFKHYLTKALKMQTHKIILLIFFSTLLNFKALPQNFWEKINSPTSKNLNSVAFIDSLNGWVAGDSGLIIHTSSGGLDWETQYLNDSLNVVNIFFLNDQLGWCSAFSMFYEPYGTYLLKTTNGGKSWSSEYFRIANSLVNSFYFLDSLTGFAVGYPQIFHRTTDGGISWSRVQQDSSIAAGFPPIAIKFYSPQYGFACGGIRDIKGVVWRTTNGGVNWKTVVDTLTTEPLYDIHIFDSLHVIAMGGDPEFGTSQVITTDGGNTWEYTALGVFYYPYSIGFRTNFEGWVPMGEQRYFLYSTDSGVNWTVVPTPDSSNILRISFPDSLHGYGIGGNGTIVKYIYQGPTNLIEAEENTPDYYLLQNYPNPFNPNTTIKYSIAEEGFVKLTVYNMLGEEVVTLVNTTQKAGKYEVNFSAIGGSASGGNAYRLSSGVYIYRIEAANFTVSRKLIFMK